MRLLSASFASVILAFFLTGCETMPVRENTVMENSPDPAKATIAIRYYTLRGDPGDPGLTVPGFIGLLLGPNPTSTFYDSVDVFDVTHDPIFLGRLTTTNALSAFENQPLIQYDVSPGRRVLMIGGRYFPGAYEEDFVEVDVVAGQVKHLSVARHGSFAPSIHIMSNHLLGPESSRACATTKGLSREEAKALVVRLDQRELKHADHFCWLLSSRTYVSRVNDSAEWSAMVSKEEIIARKARFYPVWQKLPSKVRPYSLRFPDRTPDHLNNRPNAGGSCAVC